MRGGMAPFVLFVVVFATGAAAQLPESATLDFSGAPDLQQPTDMFYNQYMGFAASADSSVPGWSSMDKPSTSEPPRFKEAIQAKPKAKPGVKSKPKSAKPAKAQPKANAKPKAKSRTRTRAKAKAKAKSKSFSKKGKSKVKAMSSSEERAPNPSSMSNVPFGTDQQQNQQKLLNSKLDTLFFNKNALSPPRTAAVSASLPNNNNDFSSFNNYNTNPPMPPAPSQQYNSNNYNNYNNNNNADIETRRLQAIQDAARTLMEATTEEIRNHQQQQQFLQPPQQPPQQAQLQPPLPLQPNNRFLQMYHTRRMQQRASSGLPKCSQEISPQAKIKCLVHKIQMMQEGQQSSFTKGVLEHLKKDENHIIAASFTK